MRTILVCVFLVGCTSPTLTNSGPLAIYSPGECDARPDDGLDDRACVQAQIDAACANGGGTVRFESGQYDFGRDPTPGSGHSGSIHVACSNLRLVGEGFSSVLMMTGDGQARAWELVRVTAPTTNFEISDLTLASDEAFNLSEQTHTLAFVAGPVTGALVHHLRINNPVTTERSGDCIRMVGEVATPISFVDIGDVLFDSCDRSGISVQRGVGGVTVHDSLFKGVGKTAIDFEPSGIGSVGPFVISGNVLERGGVSIAGQAEPAFDIVLQGNTIRGGSVQIYQVRRVSMTGNTVESVAPDAQAVVWIQKSASEVVLAANTVRRGPGSAAGPVIKVVADGSSAPSRVTILGNALSSEVDSNLLEMTGVKDVSVAYNDLDYTGAPSAFASAIYARASGFSLDRLAISGNRIKGPLAFAIRLASSPYGVGAALVSGNMSSGPPVGLRCEGAAAFMKPIVHAGNYYDGATASTGCLNLVPQVP